jgi:hypothetical protein
MVEASLAAENGARLIRQASCSMGVVSGGSTSLDKFIGLEACGKLSNMTLAQLLTFSVVHGLHDDAVGKLECEIITNHLNQFAWYDKSKRVSADYRKKIRALVSCAIKRLYSHDICATSTAKSIGVSRQNFHKTWFDREKEIYSMVVTWYYEAEKTFTGKRFE